MARLARAARAEARLEIVTVELELVVELLLEAEVLAAVWVEDVVAEVVSADSVAVSRRLDKVESRLLPMLPVDITFLNYARGILVSAEAGKP